MLYAGRLSAEKGIEDFLAATEGLASRDRRRRADSPCRRASGLSRRRDLGRYYERAAVVCVPSRREGYGMVVREAMAYGRPVVATPVGGLLDAVEDGVTGLLVDRGALRSAIERLFGDPELRARMGNAARATARLRWSPEAAADALVDAYDDAVRRA